MKTAFKHGQFLFFLFIAVELFQPPHVCMKMASHPQHEKWNQINQTVITYFEVFQMSLLTNA